jgi:mannose-6-phosphate isomerase-like protein (cupin superfamily)
MRASLLVLVLALACGDAHGAAPAATRHRVDAEATGEVQAAVVDDAITLVKGTEVERITAMLASGTKTGDIFLTRPGVQLVESRRVHDGSVEVHEEWADVTYVQAGHATIVTGGDVRGAAALPARGEHRGGEIVGGTSHEVGPGDVLLVPAGVPHQFRVAADDSIRYLTIKVPRVNTMSP